MAPHDLCELETNPFSTTSDRGELVRMIKQNGVVCKSIFTKCFSNGFTGKFNFLFEFLSYYIEICFLFKDDKFARWTNFIARYNRRYDVFAFARVLLTYKGVELNIYKLNNTLVEFNGSHFHFSKCIK